MVLAMSCRERSGPAGGWPLTSCLQAVYDGLREVINQSRPDALVIEDIFYGKEHQESDSTGSCTWGGDPGRKTLWDPGL